MTDKFGYLMKAEAESHMMQELCELKEKIVKRDLHICFAFEREAFEVGERVRLSWGAGHSEDKEIWKIT